MLKFVLCGIILFYLVQLNFGRELSVEFIDVIDEMPEKKWAAYKVIILIVEQKHLQKIMKII